MLIKIKDADSFRCAVNARADKDFQAVFRYVRLSPKGALTGCDGYVLAHNPNGVHPFGGDEELFIRPAKNVPTTAKAICIDTDAKIIRWSKRPVAHDGEAGEVAPDANWLAQCTEVVACDLAFGGFQFPDVERVIPSARMPGAVGPVAFNIKYVERLTKGIDFPARSNSPIVIERSGPANAPAVLYYPGGDPDLTLLIVPLRIDDLVKEARLRPVNGAEKAA